MSTPPVVLGDVLSSPPADGVSALRFSRDSDLLLAASWDKTVRLYDAASFTARGTIHLAAPVLGVCAQDDANAYAGSLDGQVSRLSLPGLHASPLGSHGAAVRCVEFSASRGLVLSGSWDASVRAWDPRAPPHQACTHVVSLPGKVYTMSTSRDTLVIGTSDRHILVYDLRKLVPGQQSPSPDQTRESSLKFQTRAIAAFPDGRGYAVGSVEGRVAMEYFDMSPAAQASKYAFKCHRSNEDGRDVAFPVHSIVFHPGFGTFATGGGDGVINLWDGENKKRLFQISKYPNTIAAMAFSRDGSMLAVASSYTYERGTTNAPGRDEIFVRRMQEVEVRPRQRKA
ncbi:hypothetical protein FOA52_012760 [Chlamydomonas sp. UWO 241]|nr:hypothetical protein FOA52_012760 [Chlamydomonas sp. UWO 241]